MAVYVSNLVINTGATFSQTFSLENISSNDALDLSGFSAMSQMRNCLLYTSPSPRDGLLSRMPSSA